jgi:hypothetical protein
MARDIFSAQIGIPYMLKTYTPNAPKSLTCLGKIQAIVSLYRQPFLQSVTPCVSENR